MLSFKPTQSFNKSKQVGGMMSVNMGADIAIQYAEHKGNSSERKIAQVMTPLNT